MSIKKEITLIAEACEIYTIVLAKVHSVENHFSYIRLTDMHTPFNTNGPHQAKILVSILHISIAGCYRPVRVADGPIMARYRFM